MKKNVQLDELFRKAEVFAFKFYRRLDPRHNIDHAKRTVKLAELIAEKEGANIAVCKIGALLHQFHNTKVIKNFLIKNCPNQELIENILHCVRCSKRNTIRYAKTLEAKVVFDADKLQMLGPFGFLREISSQIVNGYNFKIAAKRVWKIQQAIYTKFLQTQTAGELATKPHEIVRQFIYFFEEWDKKGS